MALELKEIEAIEGNGSSWFKLVQATKEIRLTKKTQLHKPNNISNRWQSLPLGYSSVSYSLEYIQGIIFLQDFLNLFISFGIRKLVRKNKI